MINLMPICCWVISLSLQLTLLTSVVAGDEQKKLPVTFQFPQIIATPPVQIKLHLVEGVKPSRPEKKMVIDGVVTDAPWLRYPPAFYRISERFTLIRDHDGQGFVWDAQEKKLEAIGRLTLFSVKDLGMVCYRRVDPQNLETVEVFDFDLTTGKPRLLYRGKLGYPIGNWQGGLLARESENSAVLLRPGHSAEKFSYELEGYRWVDIDAVRGNRALLLKTSKPVDIYPEPYDVEVATINLTSKKIKPIGKFAGGWTVSTAVPHPSFDLKWITPEEVRKLQELIKSSNNEQLSKTFPDAIVRKLLGGTSAHVVEGAEKLLVGPALAPAPSQSP